MPSVRDFAGTVTIIKWVAGVVGGLALMAGAYWAASDRVMSAADARWRLEQVQAAKDKEDAAEKRRIDAEIKATREKSEADIKALAKKAETGRAWVQFSVIDSKADVSTKLVKICKGLKLPAEECSSWADDAKETREEAAMKKRAAEDSSREK